MKIGPFLILRRGDFLKYDYLEIKEEKRSRGCVVSRLLIRYPRDVGNASLNLLFKSEADGFYKFITETVFPENEARFSAYLENGGRRSLFTPTDYKLTIEAVEICENVLNVKTVALSAEKNTVTAQKSFSDFFNTETGSVCRKKKASKE